MLLRYISHNRKRGELLPKIYAALEMEVKTKPAKQGYASLMKRLTIELDDNKEGE